MTRPGQTGGGLADTLDILLEAMQRLRNTPAPGQLWQGLGQTTGLIPPPPPTPAVAVPVEPAIPVGRP